MALTEINLLNEIKARIQSLSLFATVVITAEDVVEPSNLGALPACIIHLEDGADDGENAELGTLDVSLDVFVRDATGTGGDYAVTATSSSEGLVSLTDSLVSELGNATGYALFSALNITSRTPPIQVDMVGGVTARFIWGRRLQCEVILG